MKSIFTYTSINRSALFVYNFVTCYCVVLWITELFEKKKTDSNYVFRKSCRYVLYSDNIMKTKKNKMLLLQ